MARRTIRRAGYKAKGDAGTPSVDSVASGPQASAEQSPQPPGEDRAAAKGLSPWERVSHDPAKLESAKQRHSEGIKRAAAERRERERRKQEKRAAREQAKPAPQDLKPAATASTFNQGGIAKILFSLHFMAANFFHEQALQLDEKESEQFARVIMEASAAWGHPELSDKALATLNLCGTMVVIYGPRAVVIARRQHQPKIPPVPPPTGNAYGDAARTTQQQAAAPPQQRAAAPAPQQTAAQAVRPNGGFVQTVVSPFGDQDGMAI